MRKTADIATRSERDNAVNNNEEHINDDDSTGADTEVGAFTLKPLGLGPGLWSTLPPILKESRYSSIRSSTSKQSSEQAKIPLVGHIWTLCDGGNGFPGAYPPKNAK